MRRSIDGESRIRAWVACGSNLGDRAGYLAAARKALEQHDRITVADSSAVEETEPLGGLDQPPYLNQMLVLDTSLGARELLETCHAIEREAGRSRETRWCSRTLDLDLVRYGDLLCDQPGLTLPHPGLRDRAFWAREIAQLEAHG